MEIYTLITILTIYIIGVIVAYGLTFGSTQSLVPTDETTNQRAALLAAVVLSWLAAAMVVVMFWVNQSTDRLCFQWRRKG